MPAACIFRRMPSHYDGELQRLERQRAALLEHVGRYTEQEQAFRPAPGRWSVADVVQHLVLVEERMLVHGRSQASASPGRVRLRARVRLWLVLRVLARDVRIRAPTELVVPQMPIPVSRLGPRWEAVRADLGAYVAQFRDGTRHAPAFRHPRCGWITAAGGLRFLEAHIGHHFRQIERIVDEGGFRSRTQSA